MKHNLKKYVVSKHRNVSFLFELEIASTMPASNNETCHIAIQPMLGQRRRRWSNIVSASNNDTCHITIQHLHQLCYISELHLAFISYIVIPGLTAL